GARARGASAATRAPAWPWMHTARRAESCSGRARSSNEEVRRDDLALVLEEDADRAAPRIVIERTRHVLRARDRRTVDLDDDVARYHPELLRDALARAVDQGAPSREDPALGADGRREGDQLHLAQHGDLWRRHLRQVGD